MNVVVKDKEKIDDATFYYIVGGLLFAKSGVISLFSAFI